MKISKDKIIKLNFFEQRVIDFCNMDYIMIFFDFIIIPIGFISLYNKLKKYRKNIKYEMRTKI